MAVQAEFQPAQTAFYRGMLLKEEGKFEEAERFIKKALEFEPSNHEYHFELANVYALRYDQNPKSETRMESLKSAVGCSATTVPRSFPSGQAR